MRSRGTVDARDLSRRLHDLFRRVRGVISLFKIAYARAGIWWLIFAISMIVLAVNFTILACVLYLYL